MLKRVYGHIFRIFTAADPLRCPFCGMGRLVPGWAFAPIRGFALRLLLLLGLPMFGEAPP